MHRFFIPMFAIIIHLISLLMLLAVGLLLIRPLRIARWAKWALTGICAAVCFKVQILYLIDGESFFTPKLPSDVIIPANWAWMTLFFYTPILVLLSIILQIIRWCIPTPRRHSGGTWTTCSNTLKLCTFALTASICAAGTYNALLQPQIEEITLEHPALPQNTPPVRIALLADLHADSIAGAEFMQEVVRRTNAAQPDIIAIAGDFVDGSVAQFGSHLAPLRHLHAPMGVYGVEGNHELYSGYPEWKAFLEFLGIRMLDNEGVSLHGGRIWLAGVRDEAEKRYKQHPENYPNAATALQAAPTGCVKILLAHQPATFDKEEHALADLQLSGHTHGGMMPGLRKLIARANGGYVAGLYRENERFLYVSRGTRLWSGWLFRIANPAEITIITLKPKTPKA